MNSSSQQHIDLLRSLINVQLFSRLDGDHQHIPLFPSFGLSQLSLAVTLSFFLTRFLFHAHFVSETKRACMCVCACVRVRACVSAAISLPEHSWRSDGHGESVGQQP